MEFLFGRPTFSPDYYYNITGYIRFFPDLTVECEHPSRPVCSSCFSVSGLKRPECMSQLSKCPEGTVFAINHSNISCVSCSAGYYADRITNSCVICGPGYFSTGPVGSCTQCPNGSTTTTAGSKSVAECMPCLPGTALSSDPRTAELRLVGGSTKHEGRVEIFNPSANSWGSTTGRYWSLVNGAVVCRQLGLGPVVSVSYDSKYGISTATQYAGFKCTGEESSLSSCSWTWSPWETYRTGGNYDDDAGVVCSYDFPKCEVCTSGYATDYGNINCTACPFGFEAIGPSSEDHSSLSSCRACSTGTFGSYMFKNISRSSQHFTDGANAIVTVFDDSTCSSQSSWSFPSQSKLPLGQCILQPTGLYGKYTLASTQPTQFPTFQPTNPTGQPSRQPSRQPSSKKIILLKISYLLYFILIIT